MTGQLKPYPRLRASGVPWLGDVPEHWNVRRLKYVLRERDARSTNGTEQLLRVSQYTGVTERRRDDGGSGPDTRAESLIGYKLVSEGELVINIMLAWNGSMGVSAFSGIASPAYCVYRIGQLADPWYLHHLLRSPWYKARIKALSTGVVESRLRLYTDDLCRLEALLPPVPEQAAIVRFIDHADRRIRRYIRAKQKVIKLLEEQKQAIIHRAVIRGLDSSVRLKPSGLAWLGEVPEHWSIRQIGHLATVGNGSTPSRGNAAYWTNGTYPWLNSSKVNASTVTAADQFVTEAALRECHLPRVPAGSVLIAITGQGKTRGKAAVLGIEATINQHIAFITPRNPSELLAEYLRTFLAAAYAEFRRLSDDSGSTRGALTCEELRHFRIALPPISAQRQIVSSVNSEAARADRALMVAEREILLVREYRARLISDVVTGKLDVREAAARLPDDGDESDPLDSVQESESRQSEEDDDDSTEVLEAAQA